MLKISFLNSRNTTRLEDVKFHHMSVTSHHWPCHGPLECYKTFLIFYWNYTRNYTRNYVSPAAIFKKPQVRDPETFTADKNLLGAAVLLTSRLSSTPSALEAIPSSSPPSVSLYDGACTPAGLGHEVQPAAELLIKHPVLHGLLTLCLAGCRRPVCEPDTSGLTSFYSEGPLSSHFEALRMKIFEYVPKEIHSVLWVSLLGFITPFRGSGIPQFDGLWALFSAQCPLMTTSSGFLFQPLKGL